MALSKVVLPHPDGPTRAQNCPGGMSMLQDSTAITDPLRSLVMKHATSTDLSNEAIRGGMRTMYEDGLIKAVRGVTTFEEVLRVTRES